MTAPTLKERAILMSRGGLSNDVISGVLGISLDDVEALMVQANPDIELPGGDAVVLVETTVLTDDEIKALPSVVVPVVPVVPDGTLFLPIWAVLVFSSEDHEYTNIDVDAILQIDKFAPMGGGHPHSTPPYDFLAGGFTPLTVVMGPAYDVEVFDLGAGNEFGYTAVGEVADIDEPNPTPVIYMSNGSGDLTGGNPTNTLTVTVVYTLVDLT